MAHRRRVSFFCFCFSIFFSLVTTWFQFRIIFCDLTFAQILQSWFTDLLFGVSLLLSRVDLFPVCYQRPFHQPLGYPRSAFHEVRYVALLFSFVPLESLFPDSGMFSGASSDPPPTTILSSSAILTVPKTVDDGRPRRDVLVASLFYSSGHAALYFFSLFRLNLLTSSLVERSISLPSSTLERHLPPFSSYLEKLFKSLAVMTSRAQRFVHSPFMAYEHFTSNLLQIREKKIDVQAINYEVPSKVLPLCINFEVSRCGLFGKELLHSSYCNRIL
ncbi:hypothetical protein AtEden1_Chr2g0229511 [Arabidopsis thaliana]